MIDKSNEEISDLIRDWLVDNASALATVIGLAVAMSLGYQWWQGRGEEQKSHIAFQMDNLQSALQPVSAEAKVNLEQARTLQTTIAKEADSGSLRDLSALLLASQEEEGKRESLLSQAADSDDALVSGLARYHLVMQALVKGDYKAASAQVELMRNGAMSEQVPLLQATIAQAQGEYQSALTLYQNLKPEQRDVLAEMVINDLEVRALLKP